MIVVYVAMAVNATRKDVLSMGAQLLTGMWFLTSWVALNQVAMVLHPRV